MKRRHFCLFLCMLVVSAPNALAQWSVKADASGGLGLMYGFRGTILEEESKYLMHSLGATAVDVQYKSPGFTWKSSISGGFEFINTDYFNADMLMDGGEMLGMNGVVTLSQDAPMNFKYRSDFSWTRPSGRKVEAWIQYRFNFNEGYRMNIRYDLDRNTGFYGEVPYLLSHDFTTGARFTRDLGSARRQLVGDLVYGHNARQQETEYITVHLEDSSIDAWSDMYRITPHSHVDLVTGELHFRDSVTSEKVKIGRAHV